MSNIEVPKHAVEISREDFLKMYWDDDYKCYVDMDNTLCDVYVIDEIYYRVEKGQK